jgi:hypothetical protein
MALLGALAPAGPHFITENIMRGIVFIFVAVAAYLFVWKPAKKRAALSLEACAICNR